MYAIKADNSFLVTVAYGTACTSSTPKIFKSFDEAESSLNYFLSEMHRLDKFYMEQAFSESKKAEEAKVKIAKLNAQLEELYKLPFGEVEKKVIRIRKEIESAGFYARNNSVASYKKTASRIRKILNTKPVVVKLTASMN